jgi:hypothetical protein
MSRQQMYRSIQRGKEVPCNLVMRWQNNCYTPFHWEPTTHEMTIPSVNSACSTVCFGIKTPVRPKKPENKTVAHDKAAWGDLPPPGNKTRKLKAAWGDLPPPGNKTRKLKAAWGDLPPPGNKTRKLKAFQILPNSVTPRDPQPLNIVIYLPWARFNSDSLRAGRI